MDQNSFGQILLSLNLITPDQLEKVIALKQRGEDKPLGELLVELKILDEKTVRTILNIQNRRPKQEAAQPDAKAQELRARLAAGDLYEFIQHARQLGASHLYIGASESPTVRQHGILAELPCEALTAERARAMLLEPMSDEERARFAAEKTVDLMCEHEGCGRFRMNVFQHNGGLCGVVRMINEQIRPFDELGLPMTLLNMANKSSGLILVTGPTRSGKTTTLTSIIDYINRTDKRHIIIIEDPIEAMHSDAQSLVSHRRVGEHTRSFHQAVRASLREDPDVIVISELRDPETITTAITAAETGHLVLGTMHTRSADRTILRILDQFPPQKRSNVRTILAGVLRAIICQELVPNVEGTGCSLAYEILLGNAAVANLIREDRVWQIPMSMQLAASEGMVLMDDSLLALVRKGAISLEEALARASDHEKFLKLIQQSGAVPKGSSSRFAYKTRQTKSASSSEGTRVVPKQNQTPQS